MDAYNCILVVTLTTGISYYVSEDCWLYTNIDASRIFSSAEMAKDWWEAHKTAVYWNEEQTPERIRSVEIYKIGLISMGEIPV